MKPRINEVTETDIYSTRARVGRTVQEPEGMVYWGKRDGKACVYKTLFL